MLPRGPIDLSESAETKAHLPTVSAKCCANHLTSQVSGYSEYSTHTEGCESDLRELRGLEKRKASTPEFITNSQVLGQGMQSVYVTVWVLMT